MRKFTFLRKKIQAKDRSLQENLVTRYFEDLDLNDQDHEAGQTGFNSNDVYNRVIETIDAMPVKPAGISKKWMVAASLVAIAASSTLIYQYRTQVLDVISPIAQQQIATINGQVANLTLADGTKVWLNGGSKLSYPEAFRGDKRQITLTGEAFFEVAHDATKAFIVHTGDIKTQVLGTSFNVKAYPEDKVVKVDVATGKVGVVTPAAKTVFLLPSDEVMVNKANHSAITSKGVDVNTLAGWKSGDFNVKNMPLPEVLNAIYHRYNIQVKADANLVKCSITANFTNVSLQNIIKIISKLVRGRAYADGPGYYLKGKGC